MEEKNKVLARNKWGKGAAGKGKNRTGASGNAGFAGGRKVWERPAGDAWFALRISR